MPNYRQILDYGGMYDREKLFWKDIEDVVITAACAPPGGGRNPLTPRFVRHFAMLYIPSPTEESLKNIFRFVYHQKHDLIYLYCFRKKLHF